MGRLAARYIRLSIQRFWPEFREGEVVMALGYAVPYIEAMRGTGIKILPMMTVSQGAIYWPSDGDNRTVLLKDKYLPLADQSVDRALLVHSLEHSRNINNTLDELWRVLVPGGKVLIVVPNRRSMWSQAASTPFGCGQPFTINQLSRKLSEKRFTIVGHQTVLHMVPLTWRWTLKMAGFMEWLGDKTLPPAGGAIVMEAEKQIYAAIPQPVKELVREKVPYAVPAAVSRV